jgi:lipopolysaccharide transport system permease protein
MERAPVFQIRPVTGWIGVNWRELWQARDLLVQLVSRDIKVRYKQTALGAAWAILQPLLTMVVFSVFFGRLARVPSDGIPYPLFAYCGLLPWQLFVQAVNESAHSLVQNEPLVTKVYVPRLILPVAAALGGVVDFAVASVLLAALMVGYGWWPGLAVVVLPALVALALAAALAVGLWLAALNIQYRDVRYTLPFLIQFWLLATPIAYPASLVPETWRVLYGLNPMAGVVEAFRWALVGGPAPGPMLAVSVVTVAVLLLGGLAYFRHMERQFADVV